MNRVLVVGTTLHFWLEEEAILKRLIAEFPGDVVYRPHPRRGGSWEWASVLTLKQQLQEAEVIVAAFSTVVIEAALFGRPAILVGFGNGEQGRVLDHWQYEHMAGVAGWPTTRIAKSSASLIAAISDALSKPLSHEQRLELRNRALKIANCAPGIRARFCDALEACR